MSARGDSFILTTGLYYFVSMPIKKVRNKDGPLMAKKLFIVTENEVATYVATHQNKLLDMIDALANENPGVSANDLIAFARENYVLTSSLSVPVEEPAGELTLAEETVEETPVFLEDLTEEPAPVEEPVVEIIEETVEEIVLENPVLEEEHVFEEPVPVEEPIMELPPVVVDDESYETPEYQDVVEPEVTQESTTDEMFDAPVAFRNNRRYHGLFREASKIDDIG